MKLLSYKKIIFFSFLVLAGCNDKPAEQVLDKGDPERFIDLSYEDVTYSLSSKDSISRISSAIAKETPSKAELKCLYFDSKCSKVKEILKRHSVPFTSVSDKSNVVIISYEKVVVRDCNPRYADNTYLSSRDAHPAFGCAISANTLQMVSDKAQFTNPSLLGYSDAEKGVQSYQKYMKVSGSGSSGDKSSSGSGSSSSPSSK